MREEDQASWWKNAVIYQVYPRSFADGNGDGIGDLSGVKAHLDCLRELSVDAIWFSPFYPSPGRDMGYDVTDYFSIDPVYGTLEEFVELLDLAHERGIRVLVDVVPNHSSSEHPLFRSALDSTPGSAERDRYVFRYSGQEPPNNWGSIFGGPAWSPVEPLTGKEEDRGWWYLHLFDSSQPDFNWDNPDVHHHFEEYLRFWLDLGVDGFRVDVAHGLVKKPGLPDDELGLAQFDVDPEHAWAAREAAPYSDQDEVHDIYRGWRAILEEYGPSRIMIGEVGVTDPIRRGRYVRDDEMHQAFTFSVVRAGWDPKRLSKALQGAHADQQATGAINTWVMSNHDIVRHATRLGYPRGSVYDAGFGPESPRPDAVIGLRRAIAYTQFILALPGSAYLYNGEELGLPEVLDLPPESRMDPTWNRTKGRAYGRDGCRVPLPWTGDVEADWGFQPWLPWPQGWEKYAAEAQETDPDSPLNRYRTMLRLRRELGLGLGPWQVLTSEPDVVAVQAGDILTAINMGISDSPAGPAGQILLASGGARVEDGQTWLAPNSAVWVRL